jgi:hypothetical protein
LFQQCSATKGSERNEERKKCGKRMGNRGISSGGKRQGYTETKAHKQKQFVSPKF